MQANLTWPQARELARNGSKVRRAGWSDEMIFRTDGDLFWRESSAGTEVVTPADVSYTDLIAHDWTDASVAQAACVGLNDPSVPPITPGAITFHLTASNVARATNDSGSGNVTFGYNEYDPTTGAVTTWWNGVDRTWSMYDGNPVPLYGFSGFDIFPFFSGGFVMQITGSAKNTSINADSWDQNLRGKTFFNNQGKGTLDIVNLSLSSVLLPMSPDFPNAVFIGVAAANKIPGSWGTDHDGRRSEIPFVWPEYSFDLTITITPS